MFCTHTLSAAQVLAVASNGKWEIEYDPYENVDTLGAKAIAACRAKGGTDPKIVWSLRYYYTLHGNIPKEQRMAGRAIVVSDNGTGNIVGWSFNQPYHNTHRAIEDCHKKGGRNSKVVAKF